MISRKEVAENILSYIRENNFEPQNIEYLNDYSVFDLGQDGIVHFEIKEIPGWIFGMWIETDDEKLKNKNNYNYPAIQFFCKHKKNIDKFAPSRSFHLINLFLEDIEEYDNFKLSKIINMLQMIKRHPIISFVMDVEGTQYYNGSYFICYLKNMANNNVNN